MVVFSITFGGPAAEAFQAVLAPKGAARRWGAAMPAGTYGSVNLHTGRVLTTLPITGWSGRGPSISFALYHNMNSGWGPDGGVLGDASMNGSVNEGDVDPFVEIMLDPAPSEANLDVADFNGDAIVDETDFGSFVETLLSQPAEPDWRHSYSASLRTSSGFVWLTRDDGTEDTFTWNAATGSWDAPAGVFDKLGYDSIQDRYLLTSKNQWKARFERVSAGSSYYRLEWISDAALDASDQATNKVMCEYNMAGAASGKLKLVRDTQGKELQLRYNAAAKLNEIEDPIGRKWQILYDDPNSPGTPTQDGTGPLRAVADPMNFRATVAYDATWNLSSVQDKNGNAFTFAYGEGRLTHIYDPVPYQSQVQSFTYGPPSGSSFGMRYIDRRGKLWRYKFEHTPGNLVTLTNPLNKSWSLNYSLGGNLSHEVTSVKDPYLKTWSTAYGGPANVTSTTDPLGNVWTYEYDGLNSLTSVTPPGTTPGSGNTQKQTRMYYEDARNPTSATRIEEPSAADGQPVPVTLMEYYSIDKPADFGRMKRVTPAHSASASPVRTRFQYEVETLFGWKEKRMVTEGGDDLNLAGGGGVSGSSTSNGAGQTTDASNGLSCPIINYDGNGNATSSDCLYCAALENGWESEFLIGDGRPRTCAAPPGMGVYSILRTGCLNAAPYTGMREPTNLAYCVEEPNLGGQSPSYSRDEAFDFDELGRLRERTITSSEATGAGGAAIARAFTYTPDWTTGTDVTAGPDGQVTTITRDNAGRVSSVTRTRQGSPIITAMVTYYDDDRVNTITYGNGMCVKYTYDDAGRMKTIRHLKSCTDLLHGLEYTWSSDGLVTQIVETADGEQPVSIGFGYDRRNRLTSEARDGANGYQFSYSYDLAGNRLTKVQWIPGTGQAMFSTTYKYDVENPTLYGSQGNRLMSEERRNWLDQIVGQKWYEYDPRGRAKLVTRKVAGDVDGSGTQWYRGTRLYYDTREHLWLAIAEKWQLDAGGNPTVCQRTSAMEYRYDEARARYMVRPRNAVTLAVDDPMAGTWHDYDGADIYGDYAVSGTAQAPVATQTIAHVPGVAQYDVATLVTNYIHGNLIGTNEMMTGPGQMVERRAVYTAFGERVYLSGTAESRYGYAGEWGYQEARGTDPIAELGWLHVGERYYDPASGRFVQRDPIGMQGGANVYAYVSSQVTLAVDPSGLSSMARGDVALPALLEAGGGVGDLAGKIAYINGQAYRITQSALAVGTPVVAGAGNLTLKTCVQITAVPVNGGNPIYVPSVTLGQVAQALNNAPKSGGSMILNVLLVVTIAVITLLAALRARGRSAIWRARDCHGLSGRERSVCLMSYALGALINYRHGAIEPVSTEIIDNQLRETFELTLSSLRHVFSRVPWNRCADGNFKIPPLASEVFKELQRCGSSGVQQDSRWPAFDLRGNAMRAEVASSGAERVRVILVSTQERSNVLLGN